jgi:imidazolonepropionase-like amidohydrolase
MRCRALSLFGAAAIGFAVLPCAGLAQGDFLTAPTVKAPDRWVILQAGTLMADASKPIARTVSVVVKNDKIESVRAGFVDASALTGVSAAQVTVVDLKDKFVMAGLIDAHVHVALVSWPAALRNAKQMVVAGATTVRDAGSTPEVIFPLRDAINQGLAFGPRILASGAPISTTGGHADFRNGNFLQELAPPAYTSGICDGEGECLKKTRMQIQLGADQVKVIATAGVLDNSDTGLEQQFTDAELRAIVDASHLMKRKVMAHAIGAEGIKAAVRAGVDSIEHGNYLDDEGAQMMKKQGTYLDATLNAPDVVLKAALHPAPGTPTMSQNSLNKVMRMPEAQPGGIGRQVILARKYGVKIAVGTDFGGSPSDEMILLVKNGGMKPQEALLAATVSNADLLGITDRVGTIEAGKSADIVAFTGSPLEDIANSKKISFVMSQGHEYVGPGFQLP